MPAVTEIHHDQLILWVFSPVQIKSSILLSVIPTIEQKKVHRSRQVRYFVWTSHNATCHRNTPDQGWGYEWFINELTTKLFSICYIRCFDFPYYDVSKNFFRKEGLFAQQADIGERKHAIKTAEWIRAGGEGSQQLLISKQHLSLEALYHSNRPLPIMYYTFIHHLASLL